MHQTAIEQRAMQRAMARIAGQSRRAALDPAAQTSSRAIEDGAGTAASSPPDDRPAPPPVPPDGYAFVPAPAQMTKARVPDSNPGKAQSSDAEIDWLVAPDGIAALVRQAERAGRDWTFGWLRIDDPAQRDVLRASLQPVGGDILGASGNLVRATLPGQAADLRAISALPAVLGLGTLPTERKLAAMPPETLAKPGHERVPVFITLMTSDAEGRWRRALENLGVVVGRFDEDVRAYAANIEVAALEAVAAADFVLDVQPIRVVRAGHDLAVPAMGADALRTYLGSPGMFSGGGASTPIGVMDSGLNLNHPDIASNRASVCGANFLTTSGDVPADEADLWRDESGHGTHVTGTFAGNGYNDARFAGVAPGVRHIRFAKVLGTDGGGQAEGVMSGMDYLARATGCGGWTSTEEVQPLIVNMSLAVASLRFDGRDVEVRKIDGLAWAERQLYVVVQGNENIQAFSNYSAAKSTLAVGAVRNDGELAAFSSLGPTADGRLAPQLVASGVLVHSVQGDGSQDEYVTLSGTSMATPAVAGIAALLMDAAPAHRRQPALTRARLMASAIKPDAWLQAPTRFPADNTNGPGPLQNQYGLGKASARTSVLNRDAADGWTSGSAVSEPANGEYAWHDITVPAGASRLDLVLTWDESPGESIGSPVLNDLDLWLDHGANCGAGACGERSSLSDKDNVEWIVVRDPPAGVHRAKVVAQRVYGAAPRAALAWTIIRGPATPTLEISADRAVLNGSGDHQLGVSVSADGYVAAGTKLTIGCRAADGVAPCEGVTVSAVEAEREDGVSIRDLNGARAQGNTEITPVDVLVNFAHDATFPLGEVAVGADQRVSFTVSLADNAPYQAVRLYFTASAWNASGASTVVRLVADGGSREGTAVAQPANDDFALAAAIAGAAGERAFDPLRATTESGEILFQPQSINVAHSLWYSWSAPAAGLYRFSVANESIGRVDILRGERLAALERVAFGTGGAAFFAAAGQRFSVRLATPHSTPNTLRWAQGRPTNDDFAAATRIAGATGSYDDSNLGASMEPGEWFGNAAATVWYRWTAPHSANFTFAAQGQTRTLVFVGSQVADLRLVSGWPTVDATFPARQGSEYHIAVAARDGMTVDGVYTLFWHERDPAITTPLANNQLAAATALPEQSSATEALAIDDHSNVEPGEPAATGVRTNWWAWRAPSTGRTTFRLLGTGGQLFRIAAFTGSSVADLRLAGASAPYDATPEFTLDAIADERYRISLGFMADDIAAFEALSAEPRLEWAPTPANDSLAAAARIGGSSGSATGNNKYATTESNEPSRNLGHSSLWWDFEAPNTAAYSFEATGGNRTLAVYRRAGDGFDNLELVASGLGHVTFSAVAGRRYAIRVGTRGDAAGDFTLRWRSQTANGEARHTVPLFLAVDDGSPQPGRAGCELPPNAIEQEQREGFVRIINRSADSGTVRIHAVDDAGRPGREAVTLEIGGNQTRHFNSGDLERGNPGKGLSGAVGDGEGDWHLRLETDLSIKVLAYARTKPGGFLTSLLDLAPCEGRSCQIDFFNPASNRNQCSLLRIVNRGDTAAAVTVTGKDDAGALPGSAVSFEVPAQAARTLTAGDLEGGSGAGLSGGLGDGEGKWQLTVAADQPILALSLLESPARLLTNLSATAP